MAKGNWLTKLEEYAGPYREKWGGMHCDCEWKAEWEGKCVHYTINELDAAAYVTLERLKARDEWLSTDAWELLFDTIDEAKEYASGADKEFFDSATHLKRVQEDYQSVQKWLESEYGLRIKVAN